MINSLFDDAFTGLFGRKQGLSEEEEDEINDLLACKDEDDALDYKEVYDRLPSILDRLDEDTHRQDIDKVEKALKHYRLLTDNRSLAEALDDVIESICTFAGSGMSYLGEHMRYKPAEHGRDLPKNGGWIMVTEVLPVEEKLRPIPYSVYYAKPAPVMKEVPVDATLTRSKKIVKVPYYKVRIATENGEVHLWPHEYVVMRDPNALLAEVGNSFDMIRLGGDANYDDAKVHYLSTRGVDSGGVYKLLLGSLNSTNHVYFKIREGEPREFWEFYIDALHKGLDPRMAIHIWERQKAGLPLFNVQIVKEDGDQDPNSQSGTQNDPAESAPEDKARTGRSSTGKKRKR